MNKIMLRVVRVFSIFSCFIAFSNLMFSEWNIEEPTTEISRELAGEIFGRDFILESAVWKRDSLTIRSEGKVGAWPESEIIIFLGSTDQTEWLVTPKIPQGEAPHIHMKFGKEHAAFPGILMFTSEYSMYLKLVKRTGSTAHFQIHLSLPDYKKSFLIGIFNAEVAF